MKLLDISANCYAHLMNNTIYLYVNNEFASKPLDTNNMTKFLSKKD